MDSQRVFSPRPPVTSAGTESRLPALDDKMSDDRAATMARCGLLSTGSIRAVRATAAPQGTQPGKPVFLLKSVMQFQTKEAMPSVYRVSVTLNRGEYLFFILGSGDDKKGILGKGYDFGID